jgi:hypothetical protein
VFTTKNGATARYRAEIPPMWMRSTCTATEIEYNNVSIIAVIAVNKDGYHKVSSAAEGMKEDKTSWVGFSGGLRVEGWME